MVWTITPFTIILNSIIFGKRYFTEWHVFTIASVVAFVFLCVSFVLYGGVAVAFRNRFPKDDQFLKRTLIIVGLFIIMTGLLIILLFTIYESIGSLNFTISEGRFIGGLQRHRGIEYIPDHTTRSSGQVCELQGNPG